MEILFSIIILFWSGVEMLEHTNVFRTLVLEIFLLTFQLLLFTSSRMVSTFQSLYAGQ